MASNVQAHRADASQPSSGALLSGLSVCGQTRNTASKATEWSLGHDPAPRSDERGNGGFNRREDRASHLLATDTQLGM